jgi:hypothetical protein
VKNRPGPDDDCLLDPSLPKCKAPCDENNVCNCPEGFIMNEDDNCYPDKPCPKGFERHAEDETGTCYPIKEPPCQAGSSQADINDKCPPSKSLSLDISIAKNPIVRGNVQTITFYVSDDEHPPKNIGGAVIEGAVKYASGHPEPISGDRW